MIGASALAARALADAARRELASEWGGPEPGTERNPARARILPREPARRASVHKP